MEYIKQEILDGLASIDKKPIKLIEFCKSVNISYANENYIPVIIITRAILDYIPPIFGYRNTSQVHSNLKDKKTFKDALRVIDQSTRLMADDILHNQASVNEIIKIDKASCDLVRDNLILIIAETISQINSNDLRGTSTNRDDEGTGTKSQLELFKKYIKNKEAWAKEFINSDEVWIYSKDNLFQIHSLDNHQDFSEPWTQLWPDAKGSGKYGVDLRVNGTTIKQFPMIYFDGGRESIIMPKMEIDKSDTNFWEGKDLYGGSYKNVNYYIEKDSIEYNLSELIGSGVERVARRSHIEIR